MANHKDSIVNIILPANMYVISEDLNKMNRQKREPIIALGVKNSKACLSKLGQIYKLKQMLAIVYAHVSRGVQERKRDNVKSLRKIYFIVTRACTERTYPGDIFHGDESELYFLAHPVNL